MIDVMCGCPTPRPVAESGIGKAYTCAKCGRAVYLICAEQLAEGNGGGDFDATLTVLEGPEHRGAVIQLGGIADIAVGKAPDQHLCLDDPKVSRRHAKLVRVDFGPSKWRVVDNRSTNGLFVNDLRVDDALLNDGDVVHVGGYALKFGHVAAPATATAAGGGAVCPSCEQPVAGKKAKICVHCGINVHTGRPVLTRQGVDENALYAGAESWIRLISWLVWVTPFPIPIRSEAFGTRKPYAIWTIAMATVLASITFFVAQKIDDRENALGGATAGVNWMLWAPQADGATAALPFTPAQVHKMAQKLTPDERLDYAMKYDRPGKGKPVSDDEIVTRVLTDALAGNAQFRGEFHWYQLITHAFLHDTSSVSNFVMHLGGNLVFMLCFGTRVNALIGNVATAVLYPVLAICAATAHLWSLGDGYSGPMVGASGAIMGLAGMYLILFPVHNVFCAMWISIRFVIRRLYKLKIFSLRGFWVLLIYFGYDLTMNAIESHFGAHGGVAHMAHIGGFSVGMMLGLVVLLSRQFETHGGDVLSVTLGRHAWPLIGKPGHRRRRREAAAANASMPAMAYA